MSNRSSAIERAPSAEHHDRACPVCGARLMRVPRHAEDRNLSHANRFRRFRCSSHACDWQGLQAVGSPRRTRDEPPPFSLHTARRRLAHALPIGLVTAGVVYGIWIAWTTMMTG